MKENNNFNEMAKEWNKNIPKQSYDVAYNLIEKFNIGKSKKVLDVACGTGILYSILKDRDLSAYAAVDISDNMIKEFKTDYPEANVVKGDFESEMTFGEAFDYVIIYNSIPHFNNLDEVFKNAYNNLKSGGKFIIAHSRTRNGLKQHHKDIGYVSDKKEPIPVDELLLELSERYGFKDVRIEDTNYFCFSCERY